MLKHYSLHKLHLPALEIPTASLNLQSFNVLEEQTKAIANTEKLNNEQKMAFDIIPEATYINSDN
jgi:hypothetical protein